MKRFEIELQEDRTSCVSWFISLQEFDTVSGGRDDLYLCTDRARHHVAIPRSFSRLFLVLTDHDRADNFKLDRHGEIREDELLPHTTDVLAQFYKDGYRYFHFEYEPAED